MTRMMRNLNYDFTLPLYCYLTKKNINKISNFNLKYFNNNLLTGKYYCDCKYQCISDWKKKRIGIKKIN